MGTISKTGFKNNSKKYMKKASKRVTLTHQKMLMEEWESLIGTLPKDATIGEDPNERD